MCAVGGCLHFSLLTEWKICRRQNHSFLLPPMAGCSDGRWRCFQRHRIETMKNSFQFYGNLFPLGEIRHLSRLLLPCLAFALDGAHTHTQLSLITLLAGGNFIQFIMFIEKSQSSDHLHYFYLLSFLLLLLPVSLFYPYLHAHVDFSFSEANLFIQGDFLMAALCILISCSDTPHLLVAG
jgi:hypothetical protein